jgi:DNA-binding MarR family transcriptional regulator
MPRHDNGPNEQIKSEIWTALYEFVLAEHERHLEALTEFGVSPGDLKALMRLVPGHPEPMRALADTWRCDASTVTWIVDRLEQRGLVARQAHETDRRVKVVALSGRGEQLRNRWLERAHQPPAALSALPQADLNVLHRLSTRLLPGAETTHPST